MSENNNYYKMPVNRRVYYKLHYFNYKGRAELARLVMAYARIHFEDIRYEEETWPEVKQKMPFGQLPVLEWKGKMMPQSEVIARFLAHRHGLGGEDDWQSAQIDAHVASITDAYENMADVYDDDEAKMKNLIDHYVDTVLNTLLARLESRLEDNDTGFLVGRKLTLADLALFNFYDANRNLGLSDHLIKKERVTELFNRIAEMPNIREWIDKRPDTLF